MTWWWIRVEDETKLLGTVIVEAPERELDFGSILKARINAIEEIPRGTGLKLEGGQLRDDIRVILWHLARRNRLISCEETLVMLRELEEMGI